MIGEGSLVSHLLELRDRLLRSVIAVIVLFIPLAYFANDLYAVLSDPIMSALPKGPNGESGSLTSIDPTGPFFVPFKLAFACAFALAIPYLLYQMWAFIAPGLYTHEKRLAMPILVSSSFLFYLGIVFAYYVVFPIIFAFFANSAPDGVLVQPDINSYFSLVLKLFFAFGLAFEVPVVTVILIRLGITTRDNLATKRPYIIIGAFVVGMLMTPPDIFSQTLLAVPVWLLFELGLYCSRYFLPPVDEDALDDSENGSEDNDSDDDETPALTSSDR